MSSAEQFEDLGSRLLIRAPGKINLSLLIAGKRPDGFHEIDTIMAKIDWYDELVIEQSQKEGIELLCEGDYYAPAGEENLVAQACRLACDIAGIKPKLKVTLRKNIPAGSGLGSGSSDAAAALMGVDRFAGLGLSQETLGSAAAKLGSDVPFFMNGPQARCSGRGEKIGEIRENFDFLALLILPNVTVSTKMVYENYRHIPGVYQRLNRKINSYIEKNRIDLIAQMCANTLQETSFRLHKELADLKTTVESLGIVPVCLSGSGSAMYHIVEGRDREKAKQYQRKLKDRTACRGVVVNNNRW